MDSVHLLGVTLLKAHEQPIFHVQFRSGIWCH